MRLLAAVMLCCLATLGMARARATPIPDLHPAAYGDFGHYTFALTWQPGFCASAEGCAADQPTADGIGLHGLWASRPHVLIDRDVPRETWWAKGCDLLGPHSDAQPALPVAVRQRLAQVMPHVRGDLLRHEYDKHVQCFGFDATRFFTAELAMRDAVAASRFAGWLDAHQGQTVTRDATVAAFDDAFGTTAPRAVQLRCASPSTGTGDKLLSQFWITIRTASLTRFPAGDSLTDSPVVQDNCPARFLVAAWPAPKHAGD